LVAGLLVFLGVALAQRAIEVRRRIPLPTHEIEIMGAQLFSYTEGLVFTRSQIWTTSDSGRTWLPLPSLPPTEAPLAGQHEFEPVHFYDQLFGWVMDYGGPYLTSDGGKSWRRMAIGPPRTLIHDLCFLPGGRIGWAAGGAYRIAADGEWAPNYVVRRDEPTDSLLIMEPAIFLTEDGGQSWSRAAVPRNGDWEVRSVKFVTPKVGFAAGDRGLYRSADGGKTWAPAAMPEACVASGVREVGRIVRASAFLNEKLGWLSLDDGYILRTTDGGLTVCQAGPPLQDTLIEMQFISPTEGWAVGLSWNLYRTRDGGRSWGRISFPVAVKTPSILDNRHAWILGIDGLYDVTLGTGR
jgi:photosystem II stability/assembly factor-like uncharacterized protein